MIRISDALARARAKKQSDEGFTLIELLVVVIIIGILAAIAIPVYIGVQNNAKDSATKSDIENAKTAVVAFFTRTGDYPTQLQFADLSQDGYPGVSQTGETITWVPPASGATTFCIGGVSPVGADHTFHATDSSGVVTGACGSTPAP